MALQIKALSEKQKKYAASALIALIGATLVMLITSWQMGNVVLAQWSGTLFVLSLLLGAVYVAYRAYSEDTGEAKTATQGEGVLSAGGNILSKGWNALKSLGSGTKDYWKETCKLTVVVLDQDKQPVPAADVKITSFLSTERGVTDTDGKVVLKVPKGTFKKRINVKRKGYTQTKAGKKVGWILNKEHIKTTEEEKTVTVYLLQEQQEHRIGEPPVPGSREEEYEYKLIDYMSGQIYAAAQEFRQWMEGEVKGHPDPRARLHYCAGLLGGEEQLHRRFIFTPRKARIMKIGLDKSFKDKTLSYIKEIKTCLDIMRKKTDIAKESRNVFTTGAEWVGELQSQGIGGFAASKVKNIMGGVEDYAFEQMYTIANSPIIGTGKALTKTVLSPLGVGLKWGGKLIAPIPLIGRVGQSIAQGVNWVYEPQVLPRRTANYERIVHYFEYRLNEIPSHNTPQAGKLPGIIQHSNELITSAIEYLKTAQATPSIPGTEADILKRARETIWALTRALNTRDKEKVAKNMDKLKKVIDDAAKEGVSKDVQGALINVLKRLNPAIKSLGETNGDLG